MLAHSGRAANNRAVSSATAFYVRDGEVFVAQPWTRGPWSPLHQHGGPPAALIVRALEAHVADASPAQLIRVAFEFLRPVPIAAMSIATDTLRSSRSLRIVGATMSSGGVDVMTARATFARVSSVDLPPDERHIAASPVSSAPPAPDASEPFVFPFFTEPVAYHAAVEIRIARGRWGQLPIAAWMRVRIPLLDGETPSPAQRVAAVVDSNSGVGPPVDPMRFLFPNPDLTIYLHRPLEGTWVGMEVDAFAESTGVGLARSVLRDVRSPIGQSAQSLLVSERKE